MDVMQEVFQWSFVSTGPGMLAYEGRYQGKAVFLCVGGEACVFGRRHGRGLRMHRYKTAADLLASFPKLHNTSERTP